MKSQPAIWFYPGDWLREPGLRSCSLEARGLWIDTISLMHEGQPYGHLRFGKDILPAVLPIILARMVGSDATTVERCLTELEEAGVFNRTESGVIYSRRMVRDAEIRRKRAEGGKESSKNPNVPRQKVQQNGAGGYPSDRPTSHPPVGACSDPSPVSSDPSLGVSLSSSVSSCTKDIAHPPSAVRASTPKRSIHLADEAFIRELKANPGYAGIDIDRELAKIDAWLLTPRGLGKKKTCQRVLNWLNRVEQPLTITNGPSGRLTCVNRVIPTGGKFFKNCGKPVSPGQPNKNHPFCDECMTTAVTQNNGKVHVP